MFIARNCLQTGDVLSVTDVNECLNNNGGCSHTCANMAGTHRCECPPGYTLHSNRRDCVMISE